LPEREQLAAERTDRVADVLRSAFCAPEIMGKTSGKIVDEMDDWLVVWNMNLMTFPSYWAG
jgi:hypothetical protein